MTVYLGEDSLKNLYQQVWAPASFVSALRRFALIFALKAQIFLPRLELWLLVLGQQQRSQESARQQERLASPGSGSAPYLRRVWGGSAPCLCSLHLGNPLASEDRVQLSSALLKQRERPYIAL